MLDELFKNEDLLYGIDALAKRYGVLPSEILNNLTISEFNFNMALMLKAMSIENKIAKKAQENAKRGSNVIPPKKATYKDFGLKRTVVKK